MNTSPSQIRQRLDERYELMNQLTIVTEMIRLGNDIKALQRDYLRKTGGYYIPEIRREGK